MPIHAALFDLDGTLFDRNTSVRGLICQQHAAFRALAHVPLEQFVERFVQLDARGHVPKELVYRTLAAELGLADVDQRALYTFFRSHYHRCCVGFPGLHAMLAALRARGMRLGIVTNGSVATQSGTIEALQLAPLVDVVVISGQEGIKKPDPRIFLRALERLGVDAPAAVFVGDHPVADVGGALDVGMRAIWKRDAWWEPPLSAHGTIDQLCELPALIDRLG